MIIQHKITKRTGAADNAKTIYAAYGVSPAFQHYYQLVPQYDNKAHRNIMQHDSTGHRLSNDVAITIRQFAYNCKNWCHLIE